MQPAAVHEHGREDRRGLFRPGRALQPVDELFRYDAPVQEEAVHIDGAEGELVQEDAYGCGDERHVDVGGGAAARAIADGDHTGLAYPLRQGVSGLRAALFTYRARTNSRSERRLRYLRTCGVTSSCRERRTTARSARRQTPRARWSRAPACEPEGRMNVRSGGTFASYSSMRRSRSAALRSGSRNMRPFSARGPDSLASSEPTLNSSFWTAWRGAVIRRWRRNDTATPRAGFSSTTPP